MNSMLLCDGYKLDHRRQYPNNTTLIYSNFTARKSRIPEIDHIVFFGLQYFVEEYLGNKFNKDFFNKPVDEVAEEYTNEVNTYLGKNYVGIEHIVALHKLGYLPIMVKAVPEGTKVPIGLPCLTIFNTMPEFFWLTNYFETILSCVLWKPCTSATLANRYRKVFDKFAEETSDIVDFVQFQGHDFSFRGMSGLEDAQLSGAAHLLSFSGTDTIPAINFLKKYYGANSQNELIGCSVAATEHSVQCMNADYQDDGLVDELNSFKRLITEIYPDGIVSIVSDSFDYWGILNNILPALKTQIMQRAGKVVIRPDSGDPVKIVCGDPNANTEWERKGSIEVLWDIFGGTINSKGYKQLDEHIGLIYGDSITLDRQQQILSQLKEKGFASTNMVFGIGSYTYQYVTRDTFGFAMKATYGEINGKGKNIYKDPKTDNGTKKSHKGLMALNEKMELKQECTWAEENRGMLQPVFINGTLVRKQTLADIRSRL